MHVVIWIGACYEYHIHKFKVPVYIKSSGFYAGKWEAPMSGKERGRPNPVGGHVFTKFDCHRAVCFGGRTEPGKIDETYIFDLDKKVSCGFE